MKVLSVRKGLLKGAPAPLRLQDISTHDVDYVE